MPLRSSASSGNVVVISPVLVVMVAGGPRLKSAECPLFVRQEWPYSSSETFCCGDVGSAGETQVRVSTAAGFLSRRWSGPRGSHGIVSEDTHQSRVGESVRVAGGPRLKSAECPLFVRQEWPYSSSETRCKSMCHYGVGMWR